MGDLDALNPTSRFSERVHDYVRSRPRYPDGLVDLVERETGLRPGMPIADIGAGPGLSAEPFLRRGHTVFCVEPNADMRAAADQRLSRYPGFRAVDGTGERTGLEDGSVDGILVAQAFHWLDADGAKAEFARVLRHPAWVVVVWNTRRTTGAPFLERFEALLREFGTDYERVRQRTESVRGDPSSGPGIGRLYDHGYERRVLENRQDLDLPGLRGRLRSASYTPAPGSPAYAPMMDALTALFREHAESGMVRIPYDLEVYLGRLAGGPASARPER